MRVLTLSSRSCKMSSGSKPIGFSTLVTLLHLVLVWGHDGQLVFGETVGPIEFETAAADPWDESTEVRCPIPEGYVPAVYWTLVILFLHFHDTSTLGGKKITKSLN